jgi:hypothetical protein
MARVKKFPLSERARRHFMLKQILVSTAVGALMIGSAAAQDAPARVTTPAPMAGQTQVINGQNMDQWLSSNFIGTNVIGPDEAKIGDVRDVLFEKDGRVVAYVVGVGGFLGIGAKNVAMAPSSFQVVPGKDSSDTKLKLNVTKEQLQQAASFESLRDKEAAARRTTNQTTGSGAGTGMKPSPSGAQ